MKINKEKQLTIALLTEKLQKLTGKKVTLKESLVYKPNLDDEDSFYEYQDLHDECLALQIDELEGVQINFEQLTKLIKESGKLQFEIHLDRVDPTVDGISLFYEVYNKEILTQIATYFAEVEYYEIANSITKGKINCFEIFKPLDGSLLVFPLNKGWKKLYSWVLNKNK